MQFAKEHHDEMIAAGTVFPLLTNAAEEGKGKLSPGLLGVRRADTAKDCQQWNGQYLSQNGDYPLSRTQTILSVGDDPNLLRTRQLVLKSAGHRVFSISSSGLIEDDEVCTVDAVVVCHTIRDDRIHQIVSCLREVNPLIPVLRLGESRTAQQNIHDYSLDLVEGPVSLLKKIEAILDEMRALSSAK